MHGVIVFATYIVQTLYFLHLKFLASDICCHNGFTVRFAYDLVRTPKEGFLATRLICLRMFVIICVTCPFGTEIYTFRSHPDKLSALSRAYSKPISVKSKINPI